MNSRLEKILRIRAELKELGDYDTSIAGAVGEIYAEEILGMQKVPRGTAGFDGHINGRRVAVKAKEENNRRPSETYVEVREKVLDQVDDLLVVELANGIRPTHLGPIPINELAGRPNKSRKTRYYLSEIKRVLRLREETSLRPSHD